MLLTFRHVGASRKVVAAAVSNLLLLPCVTCISLLRVNCVTQETLRRTLRRSLHCQSDRRSGAPRRLPFFAALWRHRLVCGREQRLVLQQRLNKRDPDRGWAADSASQPRSGWCPSGHCCNTSRCSGPQTRRCRHNAAKKGSRRGATPHPSVPTWGGATQPATTVSYVTQISLNNNKHV